MNKVDKYIKENTVNEKDKTYSTEKACLLASIRDGGATQLDGYCITYIKGQRIAWI